jgi:ubiquinone/menaquinone biosynthesis C-methylase UbiE
VREDGERERLRETFDRTAGRYHRARPDYPEALYNDLVTMAGLEPGDRLVEVGCATGKATLPLAAAVTRTGGPG